MHDSVRRLRDRLPRSPRTCNTIQLKHRRDPSQSRGVVGNGVQDFQVAVARVNGIVQLRVQRHEFPAGHGSAEVRLERRHRELHVAARLVQEVLQRGSVGEQRGA